MASTIIPIEEVITGERKKHKKRVRQAKKSGYWVTDPYGRRIYPL